MFRGFLKTTAMTVVAGGLVFSGLRLSQANSVMETHYFAGLVNVITPPPPPPPHTDPNTVDLSDKKGPLIPHIPGNACATQHSASMLALLPPCPDPGPMPYPIPFPRPIPCPGPFPCPGPMPHPLPPIPLPTHASPLCSATGGSVQPTPTPTVPANPHQQPLDA